MIFPESFYGFKNEDIINNPASVQATEQKPELKLNVFGLVFNLAFSFSWMYLTYHLISRINSKDLILCFNIYGKTQLSTDILFSVCNVILAIYHMLYCVIPNMGVGEHNDLQNIIPVVAVLIQMLTIFSRNLLKENHYSNYLWLVLFIMGSFSIVILTVDDSDGETSLLPYFKPWVMDTGTSEIVDHTEDRSAEEV